jgi:methionyl-tRNA formyltransferase
MPAYVLACSTPWALAAFARRRADLPGDWITAVGQHDLEPVLAYCAPRYIFFPHWSWRVPDSVISRHECVCFHMTDLPLGRGGSPLQNLIAQGARETQLTAFRMTAEFDAGPIYAKRRLGLDGAAHECYARAAELCLDLLEWIVATEPAPSPQAGEPTFFRRRQPSESAIPDGGSLKQFHDHIRMLDADGYPRAFLDHGEWRLEFRDATLGESAIEAGVTIRPKPRSET